jgi:hypothetical protein
MSNRTDLGSQGTPRRRKPNNNRWTTYEPSAEDLVWLEQQRQAAIHVSSLSAPILKQQHKAESQEDTTIAAPKSPAVDQLRRIY